MAEWVKRHTRDCIDWNKFTRLHKGAFNAATAAVGWWTKPDQTSVWPQIERSRYATFKCYFIGEPFIILLRLLSLALRWHCRPHINNINRILSVGCGEKVFPNCHGQYYELSRGHTLNNSRARSPFKQIYSANFPVFLRGGHNIAWHSRNTTSSISAFNSSADSVLFRKHDCQWICN